MTGAGRGAVSIDEGIYRVAALALEWRAEFSPPKGRALENRLIVIGNRFTKVGFLRENERRRSIVKLDQEHPAAQVLDFSQDMRSLAEV